MKRLWLASMTVGVMLAVLAVTCIPARATASQPTGAEGVAPSEGVPSDSVKFGLYAAGVGLILLGGAVGTGLAQQGIGAAVVGVVAEDRKFLGMGLILLAIPETILFICAGFAYLLFGKLH